MRNIWRLYMIAGSVAATCVIAQTLGYSDADNPSEAVGMMKTNVHSAEVMLRECSKRLPDSAPEMAANLKKWKTTEAHAIERADHYWAQMLEKQPKLQEALVRAETFFDGQFKLLEQADPEGNAKAVSNFCVQHFSDLASGVWRQRTPRLYKFLDNAP